MFDMNLQSALKKVAQDGIERYLTDRKNPKQLEEEIKLLDLDCKPSDLDQTMVDQVKQYI